MRSRQLFWLIAVGMVFFISGCGGHGPRPVAWIDYPLDNSRHPLAPLDLMAHSSSSSGVSSFIFYVDGQELEQIDTGGERFELVETNWEPAVPGIYTLEVLAIDSGGAKGSPASSLVYIGDVGVVPHQLSETIYGQCEGVSGMRLELESPIVPTGACSQVSWTADIPDDWPLYFNDQEVERIGETVVCATEVTPLKLEATTPNGACTVWQVLLVDEKLTQEEPSPAEALTIEFLAVPNQVGRGECSDLGWQVLAPEGFEVTLNETPVDYIGGLQVCPEETTEYTIRVKGGDQQEEALQVVEVIEESVPEEAHVSATDEPVSPSAPTQESSAPHPTTAPTSPPPDTTGPTISGASANPSFIYTTGGGCSPTTFIFRVSVSDPSGVATVQLNWKGSGVRSGPVMMNYSGGKYAYDLGLFNNPGDLSNFSITATDTKGNASKINPGWNLSVEQCGGR